MPGRTHAAHTQHTQHTHSTHAHTRMTPVTSLWCQHAEELTTLPVNEVWLGKCYALMMGETFRCVLNELIVLDAPKINTKVYGLLRQLYGRSTQLASVTAWPTQCQCVHTHAELAQQMFQHECLEIEHI